MSQEPVPVDTGGTTAAAHEAARTLSADPARVAAARRLRPAGGTLPALDRIAGLAARLLDAGSGRVTLLSDVQTMVGATGVQPAPGAVGEEPLAQWLCTQVAAGGVPLAIGDARADGRVAGLAPVVSGVVRSFLGVPLRGDDAQVVGAVCVFGPSTREWSPQETELLQEVAASAAAELELAALNADYAVSKALLEVAVQAAGIGTFELEVGTGKLVWDEQMYALFGMRRADLGEDLAQAMERIHPDDRGHVDADVADAVRTGVFTSAYRVLVPGAGTSTAPVVRWLEGRGRTLTDASGTSLRLVGAVHDVSAQRQVTERIAGALESMAVGYLVMDADWRMTYANAEAERITTCSRQELLGASFWAQFPATVGTVFEEHYRRAVATGRPEVFDAHYPAPLNIWVEVRAVPEGEGLALYFLDVTDRRRLQQQAEAAADRAQLLAAVTQELTGTLDPETAVARLAQLVVPALGDWCLVSLVQDDTPASTPASARASTVAGRTDQLRRGLRDAGAHHRDPASAGLLREYADRRLRELDDSAFVWQALRQDDPVLVEDATTALSSVLTDGGRAQELLVRLAPATGAIFPLRGRGHTVGLLSVFSGPDRGALTPDELATGVEVADRAGLALGSARLHRQQRDLAEGLQRSLLTAPPEPDHAQIVVRYTPAAEAAQVGGDWYDAFLQPAGATVLVIGDVVGHDTQAAAAMSQVRTVVRSMGALGAESPARMLTDTDRVLSNLQITTTATAIVARLEQTDREREDGVTRLRWSNAGHPPAVVIDEAGGVSALDEARTGAHADLLLGVLPDADRSDHEVVLARGSTVLLYTDGLVERRDQPLQQGLERLVGVLTDLAAQDVDLDTLVDGVLERMLPATPEDDVAVVAVRLHGQDRPA